MSTELDLPVPERPANAARALVIDPSDSVAVALFDLEPGEALLVGLERVVASEPIPAGHKLALRAHAPGEPVIKYGYPIGRTTREIPPGAHVHSHNLETALTGDARVGYSPVTPVAAPAIERTFEGYLRGDGRAATRNELWIVPTVGCVARTAQALAAEFRTRLADYPNLDGVHAFGHAFGCSQLGDDLENTQKVLAGLATHPNAGGTLVLGLGCENNHLGAFSRFLDGADQSRIRRLGAQDSPDEHEQGLSLLDELARGAARDRRETLPVAKLVVGVKCGGSDGLSGITANPLLGRLVTRLAASGGTAILTEVPEMFGAEAAFFSHCAGRDVFERALSLVQDFRRYYVERGQPVYENPAPGNKTGGITTLEEKSLGCVQKGGTAPITDVIAYGARAAKPGLTLLEAPGNDQVSTTALVAAGATLVLFTTGRGTPLGCPAPTVKVSTNSALSRKKPGWIDFDAGVLAQGKEQTLVDEEFLELVLAVASGRRTQNERHDQRDIGIFKSGVML